MSLRSTIKVTKGCCQGTETSWLKPSKFSIPFRTIWKNMMLSLIMGRLAFRFMFGLWHLVASTYESSEDPADYLVLREIQPSQVAASQNRAQNLTARNPDGTQPWLILSHPESSAFVQLLYSGNGALAEQHLRNKPSKVQNVSKMTPRVIGLDGLDWKGSRGKALFFWFLSDENCAKAIYIH